MKSYKELTVWQKGIDLVEEIYLLTDAFPKEELYGLVNQMRRAAVAIPSNIAEGFSRKSIKEYAQFIRIAYASGAELETQIVIAKRLRFIKSEKMRKADDILLEVMKMLNGLNDSLMSKANH